MTGDLEIVPLISKIYGNDRKLRIWLPPGYHDAQNAQTTYSVLYMFDGSWLFASLHCARNPGRSGRLMKP